MQKEGTSIPWTAVTLVLLAVATVGFFFHPGQSTTGALVYQDYGYGGYGGGYSGYSGGSYGGYIGSFGGGMPITEFYQQYSTYIDAILFLVIFLSIGKAVFLKHFNVGGKAIYIAMGVALTLGLLLWEERVGYSIIANSGPLGIAILILLCLVGCYVSATHISEKITGKKKHLLAALLTLVLSILFVRLFPDTWEWSKGAWDDVWAVLSWPVNAILNVIGINTGTLTVIINIVVFLIVLFICNKIAKKLRGS